MNSIAFWPTVIVLLIATSTDLRTRRIPNWLTAPFLLTGILAGVMTGGLGGVGRSLAGLGLASAAAGLLYYLRALGMGDVKLLAGVGAWVGPQQLILALVVTGMAGGVIAVGYALHRRVLGNCLDGAADLAAGIWRRGVRPHDTLTLDNPAAHRIPYAGAIAAGTIFSFFAR